MSAAYDSVSFVQAGAIVDPPESGIKSLVVPGDESDTVLGADPRPLDPRATRARAEAFRSLYDAHVAFVWRNLRRLGVMDRDVEDKCQEVFVVAHRRFEEFVDRGHGPRAWLFQIVLRVASDARRHRRRHPVDPDGGIAQDQQAVDPPQAAAMQRKQALDLLDRALAGIDMSRRAVLVLHEIEQMTAPEIARTLEIPLNTVYSRLRVARAELDAELARLQRVALQEVKA
ncbi:MAG: RNA polymerase sigma factor [Deltaproteobacteria bacterium]|nr:RNA polymerase sigma factor [Deltaproteobacteria bacterium]